MKGCLDSWNKNWADYVVNVMSYYAKRYATKLKATVHRNYVRPAILCGVKHSV